MELGYRDGFSILDNQDTEGLLRELTDLGLTREDDAVQRAAGWLLARPQSAHNPGMFFGSDALVAEQAQIVSDFRRALQETGLVVPMATTNLFADPAFKDGAFTSNDPKVRAYALHKTIHAIDLGVELGAKVYVFWGGREGTETDAAKNPVEALKWNREAMNFLCEYVLDQGYAATDGSGLKFALEAKPNEPRADIYNPTTGHMLAFIETLDHPEMVGLNPEVDHEHMAGLNFMHGVAQAGRERDREPTMDRHPDNLGARRVRRHHDTNLLGV